MDRVEAPWRWLERLPRHLADFADQWRGKTIADLARERVDEDPGFVALVDGRNSATS